MGENVKHTAAFLPTEDGEFNGNSTSVDPRTPVAALEDRDVDWVDVTGWGVLLGHAIPVEIARQLAERINLYHAYRAASPELLECLKDARTLLHDQEAIDLQHIDAVIAKAEGRP